MAGGMWQERVLDDRILELGPSHGNKEFRTFSYLDFRNGGRIHNVYVPEDLENKLRKSIDADSCVVHLICGNNFVSGQVSNLLVAIASGGGVLYAVDPDRIGINAEIDGSRKAYKAGTVQKYLGLGIGVIGVPLILAIVGGVMIVVGVFMWRSGERMRKSQLSKIELLEMQQRMIKRLPIVQLI